MRSAILKGLAVALVAAAVLVPAAAAKSHQPAVKLALVPLPKHVLGSAAAGLHIALGSGPQPNERGRVTGYRLSYGSLFLAKPGLDEVETGVVGYETARAARRALRRDKKDYSSGSGIIGNLTQLNLTAAETPLAVPAVGDSHFAALLTLSVASYGSVYLVDEAFRDGRYVLELGVAAGSQDLATSYAAANARVLDRRLHAVLSGRLHGHHVDLPTFRRPGPPTSGLDPKTAILQTSDFAGSTIDYKGYSYFLGALSTYELEVESAGAFDGLSQIVSVMPSTNSAGFLSAFLGAEGIAGPLAHAGTGSTQVTPVDVSAVGDNAQAAVVSISGSGQTTNYAVVALNRGTVADVVFAGNQTTIDASDVQTLAQAAAARLDAALP